MVLFKHKKKNKTGLSPGTLTYIGNNNQGETKINLIKFRDEYVKEINIKNLNKLVVPADSTDVHWINIDGIHDAEIIAAIGKQFNLHPLLLEDVMNTEQKPKLEFYDGIIFAVLKMIEFNSKKQLNTIEHISFVLGPNYLITFQEIATGDVFDPVRQRIKNSSGKTRKAGADYLFYTLIDAIVDNYFVALEHIEDKMVVIEEAILKRSSSQKLQSLYDLKLELMEMRRLIWPVREITNNLMKDESHLIKQGTFIFIRDVYDHVRQVVDTIDSFRESLTSLLDIYLSSVSHRMNSVMKVLTIISTIFMPLTFIVGIYGMNFDNMPELRWQYGYHSVLVFMFILSLIMIYFFKRKKWL